MVHGLPRLSNILSFDDKELFPMCLYLVGGCFFLRGCVGHPRKSPLLVKCEMSLPASGSSRFALVPLIVRMDFSHFHLQLGWLEIEQL
ncbi:hypothetical protein IFM89_020937 [Coptis chinensis]|uniref:Uncharacterized protein n=1 Tax=Coptis chinensis TaxID=261450 RepID=A0A835M6V0_9MAGN|nr:hypothetical protein IFM89_020937 [Coptis chinensis]